MATITWTGAVGNGSFATPGNWQGGNVPGASDDVVIGDAAGLVFVTQSATLNTVSVAAGTLLGISSGNTVDLIGNGMLSTPFGDFTIPGYGTSVNAGTIALIANATLEVSGTLANSGMINENGSGNGSQMLIGASGAFL